MENREVFWSTYNKMIAKRKVRTLGLKNTVFFSQNATDQNNPLESKGINPDLFTWQNRMYPIASSAVQKRFEHQPNLLKLVPDDIKGNSKITATSMDILFVH